MKTNDTSAEEALGGVVDPLMVAALQLVSRFGPSFVASSNCEAPLSEDDGNTGAAGMQYLWRSIYPKLPGSTRPCYNPAGKYGVRLFLGGAWRMVHVTDEVPLDGDGERAVACSSNPLELWPMILAKAVYTVYTKCGYNASLAAPFEGGANAAKQSAKFAAFAIHTLTGWVPGSPLNLGAALTADVGRVKSLRDEIIFGGALYVHPAQVPGVLEELLASENKHVGSNEPGSPPRDVGGLRTKKQYKEDYMRKQSEREELIKTLEVRESMINAVDDGVNKNAFSDAFYVSFWNGEEVQVAPILAVTYAKAEDGSDLADENLASTRVLISWEVVKKLPREEKPVDVSTLSAVDQYKAQLPKLPEPTEIKMQWLSFGDLQEKNGHILSLDSGLRTPNTAVLSRHWAVDAPVEDAGGKGKGKDKKGKGDAPAADAGPALCVEAGEMPPTLLKVSNSDFFTTQPAPGADIGASSSDVAASPESEVPADEADEAAAAVAEQAQEIKRVASAGTLVPIAPSLTLSIAVHADMPCLAKAAAVDDATTGEAATEGDAGSVTSALTSLPPSLPSNVVVVLQEMRSDSEDPLVMRVELEQAAGVPITRGTFHVPAERLSTNDKEPLLFWVRVFTKASVMITFSCGVAVEVGPAETIWESCGNGYSALVKTGEALATAADTEQILCRLPLKIAAKEGEDEAVSDDAYVAVHVTDSAIADHLLCSTFTDMKVNPDDDANCTEIENDDGSKASVFNKAKLTSFQGSTGILARSVMSKIALSSSDNITLVLRVQLNSLLNTMNENSSGDKTDIPAFPWKIVVLSKSALTTPANLQTGNTPARYIGAYYPNNDLTCFRDVIKLEKASFPVALKFGFRKCPEIVTPEASTGEGETQATPAETRRNSDAPPVGSGSPLAPRTPEHPISSPVAAAIAALEATGKHTSQYGEQLHFILTLSRNSDRRKIYEVKGRSLIQMYNICIDGFLNKGDEVPVRSAEEAPPADAKGKKDDKKGKGGGGGGDAVEILVEMRLDENAMGLPSAFISRLPYAFKTSVGGLDETTPGAVDAAFNADQEALKAAMADGSNLEAVPQHNIRAVKPQFLWEYNVMAGTVASVSHDFQDLVNLNNLKKAWDEMMPGREDSGRASLKYFLTQAKLSEDFAAEVGEGEEKPSKFNDETVASLETAIWSKFPGTADRLAVIYSENGNSFKENYHGLNIEGEKEFVYHAKIQEDRKNCQAEIARLQKLATAGVESVTVFNDTLREQTKLRIGEVIDAAYAAETAAEEVKASEEGDRENPETAVPAPNADKADPSTIAGWWQKREKYRTDTDKLNESLRVLLDRAKDAIEATDPNADPKKKKK
eukprot:GSChrysophyteH2.ASY1.ANO1.1522.1 assembled CDS